eukprot:3097959-Lingulodinium_polyedra.AAC.1
MKTSLFAGVAGGLCAVSLRAGAAEACVTARGAVGAVGAVGAAGAAGGVGPKATGLPAGLLLAGSCDA